MVKNGKSKYALNETVGSLRPTKTGFTEAGACWGGTVFLHCMEWAKKVSGIEIGRPKGTGMSSHVNTRGGKFQAE